MSKLCAICSKKLGITTGRVKLVDGNRVCSKCLKKAGFYTLGTKEIQSISNMSVSQIKERSLSKEESSSFIPTQKFDPYAYFDDNEKKVMVNTGNMSLKPKTLIQYEEIYDFSAKEDGDQIIKSGLGSAVGGGILFGPTGAVVGAIIGRGKKGKQFITNLSIELKLNSGLTFTIPIISTKTKVGSFTYKIAKDSFEGLITKFDLIVKNNQDLTSATNDLISSADEIRKFKQLLDDGIISQEEFETKKNQLL